MAEQAENTAYRAFRKSAMRFKYERALYCGGKWWRYEKLLDRADTAYNCFRQAGVEVGERICFWLTDCPDYPAAFYGLSRLGGVAVLANKALGAAEIRNLMEKTGTKKLFTTAGRYETYRARYGEISPADLFLIRAADEPAGLLPRDRNDWARLIATNRYPAADPPYAEGEKTAVEIVSASAFDQVRATAYSGAELAENVAAFLRREERIRTLLLALSFASEGGFLALHSALCGGMRVLWDTALPLKTGFRSRAEVLIGTEDLFWEFRQNTASFRGKWGALRGGVQWGNAPTPIMVKHTERAFCTAGGSGALHPFPLFTKTGEERLIYSGEIGIRPADLSALCEKVPGVRKCVCEARSGGVRLKITPEADVPAREIGFAVVRTVRRDANEKHLPDRVEFCRGQK